MAISYIGAGSLANAATSINLDFHASTASGDKVLLSVAAKYGAVSTPSGWELVKETQAGSGSAGVNSGDVRVYVFSRIYDGTEGATVTVSKATETGTVIAGRSATYRKSLGYWSAFQSTSGPDVDAGAAYSAVCADSLVFTTGDKIHAITGLNGLYTSANAAAISASGITFNQQTEFADSAVSRNDNLSWYGQYANVSAGSASAAAPTVAFTQVGTAYAGGTVAVVLHDTDTPPGPAVTDVNTDETLSPSESITITGTNFGASQGAGGVAITQESGAVSSAVTVTGWSDTSITGTVALGGLSYGATSSLVVTDNAAATGNISVTFVPAAGYSYVTLSGYPHSSGIVVGDGASPALVDGDQVEYESVASSGATVTVNADGSFTLSTTDPANFDYRVRDNTDNTWSDWATIYVNQSPVATRMAAYHRLMNLRLSL